MVSVWLVVCVCVCCVYTYVCVLGYPINIIIISSCKHLTFLLSYLPCHLPEQILLIALALALAFRLFSSSSLLSVCVMRCHLSLFSFFDNRPHSSPSSHSLVSPHDSDFWHFTRVYFVPSFFISLACFFLSFSRLGGKGQHSFCIDKPSKYLPCEMGSPSCSPVADSA